MIRIFTATGFLFSLMLPSLPAADVRAEMKRADEFGKAAPSRVIRDKVRTYWSPDDSFLIYRVNTGPGEHQFFKVNPASGEKVPAFDHALLATALGKAANQKPGETQSPAGTTGTSGGRQIPHVPGLREILALFDPGQPDLPIGLPPKGADLLPPEEADAEHPPRWRTHSAHH